MIAKMSEIANNLAIASEWEGGPDAPPEIFMGEAPLQPSSGSHLYSQREGGGLGLEQLRLLQIQLMGLQKEKAFKHLLVTSAIRGEGKTHVAANLGLSLAAEGRRKILIIDADVRKPTLHLAYGIPNSYGFKDYLIENPSSWKAVQKVKGFDLYVITAGIAACSSIGPGCVPSIQAFLQKVESTVDLVIIDSPPLLGGVDAKLLSGVSDAVLMVVASGRTPRRLIVQAQESIENDKMVGVILNRVSPALSCFRTYVEYGSPKSEKRASESKDQQKLTVLEGRSPEKGKAEGESSPHAAQEIALNSPNGEAHHGKKSDVSGTSKFSENPQSEAIIGKDEQTWASDRRATGPMILAKALQSSVPADRNNVPPVASRSAEVRLTNVDSDGGANASHPDTAEVGPELKTTEPQILTPSNDDRRRKKWDYIMGVLLFITIAFALTLGGMIGRIGYNLARVKGSPQRVTKSTPVTYPVSPSTSNARGQANSIEIEPVSPKRASLPLKSPMPSGGLAVYDDGKLVMRDPPVSHGHAETADPRNRSLTPLSSTLGNSKDSRKAYLITEVAPEYPRAAQEQRIQGPVVLDVRVDKNGRVQRLTTISGNRLLAEAATNGVQQWRFHPFYYNGQATGFDTRVTVTFRLP